MKKRTGFQVMLSLIGLVKPLMGFMVLAIAMGLAGHLCAAFLTVLGGYGVAHVLGWQMEVSLPMLFGVMILLAVLRGILRYGEQACNHFIAFKLLALIREKVFRTLRRLAPAKLEGKGKGDLISVITSDIELLEVFYAHTISPVAIAALFSLLFSLLIGRFHVALGLLALAGYCVVGIVIPLITSRRSGDDGLRFRTQSGALSGFVLDSLRGLSEILQYGQGKQRLAEMKARTEDLAQDEARMKRTAGQNQAVTNAAILVFSLGMLFSAALLYQQGQVDFLGVLIPTLAMMGSFGPCVALANLGSTLQNTFAAGNRVLDILEETPVVEEIIGQPAVTFTGAEAKNVTFSYGGETILDNLSVSIPQGSIVGITGRSGSGKSTLLKLFMRFWETQQGEIALSHTNVNRINTQISEKWRVLSPRKPTSFTTAFAGTSALPNWMPPKRNWRTLAGRPLCMIGSKACPRAMTPKSENWAAPSLGENGSGWVWPGPFSTEAASSCWMSQPAT